MIRLLTQAALRAASIVLLLAGLAVGVHLGRPSTRAVVSSPDVVQVEMDELQLLKRQQREHAAARAWQRRAESKAAEKAAKEANAAAQRARKLESAKKAARGPVLYKGPIPDSCQDYSGSRAIGCTLMLEAGFKLDEFPCLNQLWKHESGWNYKAANSAGAYGIPQALPGSKMASAGEDWKNNPATQITWGLGYIEGRYKTPCGAWAHFESAGSY